MGEPKLSKFNAAPRMMRLKTIAEDLDISAQTLRRDIHAGKLRAEVRQRGNKSTFFVTEPDYLEYRAKYFEPVKG